MEVENLLTWENLLKKFLNKMKVDEKYIDNMLSNKRNYLKISFLNNSELALQMYH